MNVSLLKIFFVTLQKNFNCIRRLRLIELQKQKGLGFKGGRKNGRINERL